MHGFVRILFSCHTKTLSEAGIGQVTCYKRDSVAMMMGAHGFCFRVALIVAIPRHCQELASVGRRRALVVATVACPWVHV